MPLITIPEGPAIGTAGKGILSPYLLSTEITGDGRKLRDLAPSSPSLIQLRHAYLVSPEIRPSIDQHYRGEVVSMAIGPGEGNKVKVISPVEKFVYYEKYGWQAEGTEKRQRVSPEGGRWQAPDGNAFWDEDGLPLRTELYRDVAIRAWEAALGKANVDPELAPALASHYWRRRVYKNFAAVLRYSNYPNGPWILSTDWNPNDDFLTVGGRSCALAETRSRPEICEKSQPSEDMTDRTTGQEFKLRIKSVNKLLSEEKPNWLKN